MAPTDLTRSLRDLDPAFLERYDLAGPRYTSYPTAPMWTPDFEGEAFAGRLAARRGPAAARPLSIYLHVPFCFERCAFCACNVIATPNRQAVAEPYLQLLETELELFARHVETRRPVVQLHLGGGTPTYLEPAQLARLHAALAGRFTLAPDAEQSIEIHVTWTTDAHLETLAGLGCNRISMGVQDFDQVSQQAIRRRQSIEQTAHVVGRARELGIDGINMDLVYGLPHQSAERFAETIGQVLELGPDRLALYNFAYLPRRMAHQRAIDPTTLPSGEAKLRIFLEAHDRLVGAGYRYIGMDHFARPDDELARAFDAGTMQRNFMGFTTRAGADLLGLGISAISSVGDCYAQNPRKLPAWSGALRAGRFATERGCALTPDDQLRRDVIAALMCRDHVDKRAIERAHGIDFERYFAEELDRLAPLVADGLLKVTPEALELGFLGRVFVRNVAMVFDAYLRRGPARDRPQFSRTL